MGLWLILDSQWYLAYKKQAETTRVDSGQHCSGMWHLPSDLESSLNLGFGEHISVVGKVDRPLNELGPGRCG